MQLLIALLSLPRIACFALGDTPKARFWGNLLGFLGCPLWLVSEGANTQWGMALASAGGMLLYGLGIWRLIQPKPKPPHPITIEVLERGPGLMPLLLQRLVIDAAVAVHEPIVGWAEVGIELLELEA